MLTLRWFAIEYKSSAIRAFIRAKVLLINISLTTGCKIKLLLKWCSVSWRSSSTCDDDMHELIHDGNSRRRTISSLLWGEDKRSILEWKQRKIFDNDSKVIVFWRIITIVSLLFKLIYSLSYLGHFRLGIHLPQAFLAYPDLQ